MAEPEGLNMSLDALIQSHQKDRQKRAGRAGKEGPLHQQTKRDGQRPFGGRGGRGQGRWQQQGRGRGRGFAQQPGRGFPVQDQQTYRIVIPNENFLPQQQRQFAAAPRPVDPYEYRKQQQCLKLEETGEVVVRFRRKTLITVRPNGDIVLDSGGTEEPAVFQTFNDALNLIGIKITALGPGNWSVSDGKSLTRFADGVVLPGKGPQHAGRGAALLAAFQNREATAASNAAAAAAGLLPPDGAGFGTPGFGGGRGAGGPWGGAPTPGFNAGMQHQNGNQMAFQQAAHMRRLQAQGRMMPF